MSHKDNVAPLEPLTVNISTSAPVVPSQSFETAGPCKKQTHSAEFWTPNFPVLYHCLAPSVCFPNTQQGFEAPFFSFFYTLLHWYHKLIFLSGCIGSSVPPWQGHVLAALQEKERRLMLIKSLLMVSDSPGIEDSSVLFSMRMYLNAVSWKQSNGYQLYPSKVCVCIQNFCCGGMVLNLLVYCQNLQILTINADIVTKPCFCGVLEPQRKMFAPSLLLQHAQGKPTLLCRDKVVQESSGTSIKKKKRKKNKVSYQKKLTSFNSLCLLRRLEVKLCFHFLSDVLVMWKSVNGEMRECFQAYISSFE